MCFAMYNSQLCTAYLPALPVLALGCRFFFFCTLSVCQPALLYSYDLKIVLFTVMFSTPFIQYIPGMWPLLTMGKVGSPTRHENLAEMAPMSIGIQKICRQDISDHIIRYQSTEERFTGVIFSFGFELTYF